MRVSRNGQVSIPAATRARWQTDRVVVVDLGDHLVMRPVSATATMLIGKYAGRGGPSADALRDEERAADAERD